MTENIAPRRGELVIEKDGRPTLRFQKFLEGIASATSGGGADGFVVANASITPATKTKITYDEKGLVTTGSDATTADITETTNLYYTSSRVASLITDGTHLTWTFDGTDLTGNVLVTLQNAYDDSLSANVAEIVMGTGEIFQITRSDDTNYFQVGTAGDPASFNVGREFFYSNDDGDVTFYDNFTGLPWLKNLNQALEFRGDTITNHGPVTGDSFNGVVLTTAGSSTKFLNEAGLYVTAGGGGVFADYKTNDYDVDGTTSYVGQQKADTGEWLLQKIEDASGDLTITWANISNNALVTTYTDAWTDRATLTYNLIGDLTI